MVRRGQDRSIETGRAREGDGVVEGRRIPIRKKPRTTSPKMNTPVTPRPLALLAATLVIAAGMTFGISFSTGAADAPAKGAQRLMQLGAPAPARESSMARPTSAAHSKCGSCTTVTSARAVDSAKGGETLAAGGKPMKLASAHGCDGCSTTVGVKGTGKAQTRTVTHGCSMPSMASVRCCQ